MTMTIAVHDLKPDHVDARNNITIVQATSLGRTTIVRMVTSDGFEVCGAYTGRTHDAPGVRVSLARDNARVRLARVQQKRSERSIGR